MAFVSFLKASKVPESLWEPLLEKIDRAEVGCEGGVQVYIPTIFTPIKQIALFPVIYTGLSSHC